MSLEFVPTAELVEEICRRSRSIVIGYIWQDRPDKHQTTLRVHYNSGGSICELIGISQQLLNQCNAAFYNQHVGPDDGQQET